MGRVYVNPTPDPDSDKPEDSPVESGRVYLGSTDAEGVVVPVVDTDGEVVKISEPGDPDAVPADPGKEEPKADDEPAGSASRDEWVTFARSKGAPSEELQPKEEGGLGRDALREKYGTPSE